MKKIIMEAVTDTESAFEVVKTAITLISEGITDGDLTSLEGFSEQLNLPSIDMMAPSTSEERASVELIDDAIVAEFLDQHRNSVEEIESNILRVETADDPDAVAEVKRAMHTIKGEAGFLNLPDIEIICHAAESYLESASFPYEIELMLDVNDWIKSALNDLSSGVPITRKAEELLPRLKSIVPGDSGSKESISESGIEESTELDSGSVESAGTGVSDDLSTPIDPDISPVASGITTAITETLGLAAAPQASDDQLNPPEGYWRLTADVSLLTDFISESKDHMEVANGELLNLESDPSNQEALNSVFRAFHTIKGIASFLELHEIRILAHDAENLLDNMRKGTLEVSHELVDVAFESMDMLSALIEKVRTAVESDYTMTPDPDIHGLLESIRAAARGEVAARVPVEHTESKLGEILVEEGLATTDDVLEALVKEQESESGKKLGEILVESEKVAARDVAAALHRQAPAAKPQKIAPKAPGPQTAGVELKETIRVDYDRLESMVDTIGELVIAEAMITQDEHILQIHAETVDKKLHNLRLISRKLQELGTTIRMVPIAGTFQKMARLVRDLSKKSGKNITFRTAGDETELDRAYVDKIGDPLVHMVRNSVDHGIETPSERAETGKNPQAEIVLRAYHEGGNIVIEIQDDGRGVNKERVLAKAIEKGLVSEEDRLSDQEIFQLIFHPGFSTAAQITEVSGRGVGMDVVKRNIEELRGQIVVHSEPGVGSTFKLVLPLTMALIDGMVVRVADERFILPVLSVVETVKAEQDMLHSLMGAGEMITMRNRQLPFYRLSRLFNLYEDDDAIKDGLVVVIE
ncbi:MAG: chemotaxis protein CheA, partial [Candidatus Aminicenantes bacterium]|nr:chemotaxis protein CheA [Candidatus Aminicenantes bacterium]